MTKVLHFDDKILTLFYTTIYIFSVSLKAISEFNNQIIFYMKGLAIR